MAEKKIDYEHLIRKNKPQAQLQVETRQSQSAQFTIPISVTVSLGGGFVGSADAEFQIAVDAFVEYPTWEDLFRANDNRALRWYIYLRDTKSCQREHLENFVDALRDAGCMNEPLLAIMGDWRNPVDAWKQTLMIIRVWCPHLEFANL